MTGCVSPAMKRRHAAQHRDLDSVLLNPRIEALGLLTPRGRLQEKDAGRHRKSLRPVLDAGPHASLSRGDLQLGLHFPEFVFTDSVKFSRHNRCETIFKLGDIRKISYFVIS